MKIWKIGIAATISILSYVILTPAFFISAILLLLSSFGFLYFKEKSGIVIYFIIFFAYWSSCALFIMDTKNIEIGKIYSARGEYNGTNTVLSSINGKGICKTVILKHKLDKNFKGRADLLIEIDKVEKSQKFITITGEIKEVNKSGFDKVRDYFLKRIREISPNKDVYGLTAAVVMGDKSGLRKEIKEKFQETGTAHIIVISGLHIGIIIFMMIKLAELLKISYKSKYILVFIILTIYCLTAGFTASVARSWIMGAVYLLSKIVWEKAEIEKSLWIAYLGILMFNPAQIFALSFQLSFGAVFALIYIYSIVKKEKENFFVEMLKMSFVIQIVLSPMFIFYFGMMPLISFAANIVIIPLGTVMVQIMFGVTAVSVIMPFLDGIGKIILKSITDVMIFYVDIFQKIPFMQIKIDNMYKSVFVVIYTIILGAAGYIFIKKSKEREEKIEKIKNKIL